MQGGSALSVAEIFDQPDDISLTSVSISFQDLFASRSRQVLKETNSVYLRAIHAKESNALLILRRIVKSFCDISMALEASLVDKFEEVEDFLQEMIDIGSASSYKLMRERTAYVLRLLLQYKLNLCPGLKSSLISCSHEFSKDQSASVRYQGILLCEQAELYEDIAKLCDDPNLRNRLTAIKALPCRNKHAEVLGRRAKDSEEEVRLEVFSKLKDLSFEEVKSKTLEIIVEAAAYDRSLKVRNLCQEAFNNYFNGRLNLEFCYNVADKLMRCLQKTQVILNFLQLEKRRKYIHKPRLIKAFMHVLGQLIKKVDSTEFTNAVLQSIMHTDYRTCSQSTLVVEAHIAKFCAQTIQVPFTEDRTIDLAATIKEFTVAGNYPSALHLFSILSSSDIIKLQYSEIFHDLWRFVIRKTHVEIAEKYWSIVDQNFKPACQGVELIKFVVKVCQSAMGVEEFITTLGEFVTELQEDLEGTHEVDEQYIEGLMGELYQLEAEKRQLIANDDASQALDIQKRIDDIKTICKQATNDSRDSLNNEKDLARILIVCAEVMRNCDRMSYSFDFQTHFFEFALRVSQHSTSLLTLAIEVVGLYSYIDLQAFEANAPLFKQWLDNSGVERRQVQLVALTVVFDSLLMKDYMTAPCSPVHDLIKTAVTFLDLLSSDIIKVAVEGFCKLLLFNRAGDDALTRQILRKFLSLIYDGDKIPDYVSQTLQVFLRNYGLISFANCKALETAMKLNISQVVKANDPKYSDARYKDHVKSSLQHLLGILSNKQKQWTVAYNAHFSLLVFLILKAIEYNKTKFSKYILALLDVIKVDEFSEKECYVADVLITHLRKTVPKVQLHKKFFDKKQRPERGWENGQDLLEQVTADHESLFNFSLLFDQLKIEETSLPQVRRGDRPLIPRKIIKIED